MRFFYSLAIVLCILSSRADAQIWWQNDFGPWGGAVHRVYEGADGVLLALTDTGIFESDDSGEDWRAIPFARGTYHLAYRTSSGTLLALEDSVVLRCPAGESSWTRGTGGIYVPKTDVWHQYGGGVFEHSSGLLFMAGYGGMYVSDDDGRSWTQYPLTRLTEGAAYWTEDDSGTVYCGSETFRPPDMTMCDIRLIDLQGERRYISRVHALGNRRLLAWCSSISSWLLSTDGGTQWTVTYDVPGRGDPWLVSSTRSGTVLALFDSSRVMYSTDRGTQWQYTAPVPVEQHDVLSAYCSAAGELFVATAFPGVYRYDMNLDRWIPRMEHMLQSATSHVLQDATGSVLTVVVADQTVRRLENDGEWRMLLEAPRPVSDMLVSSSGALLVACYGGGVLRSIDGGSTWSAPVTNGSSWNCLLELQDGRLLAGCSPGLLVSEDDGVTWDEAAALESIDVEALYQLDTGEILIGGEFGVALLDTDLGITHQTRPSWLPVVKLNADATGVLYAGTTGDGLYGSSDHGVTWSAVGFDGEDITGLVGVNTGFCFVATRTRGIHESRDGGLQWQAYNDGLQTERILDLSEAAGGHLLLATERGVARSTLPVLAPAYHTPEFTLSQGAPNPAVGTAEFTWSIPHAGSVRMLLYDLLGRTLRTVFSRTASAGLYVEHVDVSAMASGTYLCVLEFDGARKSVSFQLAR